MADTIQNLIKRKIPIFGVCLGLQGIVEYFGGKLGILPIPYHGKPSLIKVCNNNKASILEGLPELFQVGRYHSLYGNASTFTDLDVIALTLDDVVMGIQHKSLPIAGSIIYLKYTHLILY
jgi:anthranilate synthase